MKALVLCDDSRFPEAAALARKTGLGLEVQSFYKPALLEDPSDAISKHLELLDGIEVRSMHGPFGDLCPGSFDAMVRAVAWKRFEQAKAIAGRLQIEHMVLHHGYVPGTSRPDKWIERSAAFWKTFLEETPRLRVHLENMLEHGPELLSEVIAAVNRSELDVCLDIGHAHCYSKTPVAKWIERLGTQIGYVHLHDNHGERDEHLGLGAGTIPIREVCNALQEHTPNAIWAIESQVPYLETSIQWLQQHGYWTAQKKGV